MQGLYRAVPIYVIDTWKPSLTTYSLLIAFVSLLCFIANLTFLNKLAKRFSTIKLLSGLLFSGGFAVLLMIVPQHFASIWLAYGIAVIPTVMALPTATTWLSQQVTSNEQGQVLGNNQALLVFGEASSAAIFGLIASMIISLPIVLIGMILIMTGLLVLQNQS